MTMSSESPDMSPIERGFEDRRRFFEQESLGRKSGSRIGIEATAPRPCSSSQKRSDIFRDIMELD
jgi:hypothetical protein